MDANGRIKHHLSVVDDGTALWAHVEPGTAEELVAFLQSMRFMLRVEVDGSERGARRGDRGGPGSGCGAGRGA